MCSSNRGLGKGKTRNIAKVEVPRKNEYWLRFVAIIL
jgi:hypothetical protein